MECQVRDQCKRVCTTCKNLLGADVVHVLALLQHLLPNEVASSSGADAATATASHQNCRDWSIHPMHGTCISPMLAPVAPLQNLLYYHLVSLSRPVTSNQSVFSPSAIKTTPRAKRPPYQVFKSRPKDEMQNYQGATTASTNENVGGFLLHGPDLAPTDYSR
jgi:hypothetical protein